jgi:hypothetical protein
MKKEWWRKKWVPDQCQDCGNTNKSLTGNMSIDIWEIFNQYAYGYRKYLEKHPKWGIPCWYSWCGKCNFLKQVGDSYFWDHVQNLKPQLNWEEIEL